MVSAADCGALLGVDTVGALLDTDTGVAVLVLVLMIGADVVVDEVVLVLAGLLVLTDTSGLL